MELRKVLEEMMRRNASDLHIFAGFPPTFRIDGCLQPMDDAALTPEAMVELADCVLSVEQRAEFEETQEIDFGFGVPGLGRFRANVSRQRGTLAMVFRFVPFDVPTPEDLLLPDAIPGIARSSSGLVLVTGATGSGKSTTLASMIQVVNHERNAKIVTVEDPIEFLHSRGRGLVAQREVGTDTKSFAAALRHALRQDPDVIMVGEIRDRETMELAITAANTGHLVLSTLHTPDAARTIERVVSFFPTHQHREIRLLTASCLNAIVSLRLIPRSEGKGRVPAVEVMLCTPAIQEYIIDPEKTCAIRQAIREGCHQYGMQTFDQSLMRLLKEEVISYEDALAHATSPDEFALKARGIEGSSGGAWDMFESGPGEKIPS